MKQYDKYKPSAIKWLGDIPSHWGRLRMKDIGFLYGGLSGKSGDDFGQDENEHNKPFIPFTNIFNNDIIDPYKMGIVVIFDNEQQNKVQKNDLFFLMSSEDYDGLGKCSLLKVDLEDTYLNSFCKGFRLTSGKVLPEFLNKLLLSHKYKIILQNEGKGFTRMNLKTDRISGFQFFLPPIPEQTAIAAYLNERTANIDRRIELLRNKIEHYKQLRRSLISQVVTRGLNPNVKTKTSNIDWLGDVSVFCEVKRLKDVIKFLRTGLNPRTHFKLNTLDAKGYYITVRELHGFDIVVDDQTDRINNQAVLRINERSRLEIGDVLFSGTGTIGNTALVKRPAVDWGIKEGVYAMTPNHKRLNSKYLIYYLHTYFTESFFSMLSYGSTVESVPMSKLQEMSIPLFSLDEQTAIANYLDDKTAQIDTIVSKCEKQIEQLTELRRSLISQVVTGQIKVC